MKYKVENHGFKIEADTKEDLLEAINNFFEKDPYNISNNFTRDMFFKDDFNLTKEDAQGLLDNILGYFSFNWYARFKVQFYAKYGEKKSLLNQSNFNFKWLKRWLAFWHFYTFQDGTFRRIELNREKIYENRERRKNEM